MLLFHFSRSLCKKIKIVVRNAGKEILFYIFNSSFYFSLVLRTVWSCINYCYTIMPQKVLVYLLKFALIVVRF